MNKIFKSSEEVVSMFLGLVIVVILIGLVFNFFQRRRGSISLPGLVDNKQELSVTETEAQPTIANVDNSSYSVKLGDSLWKIAQEKLGNGDRWVEIAKLNDLKNPRLLVTGQKLNLPGNKDVSVTQNKDQVTTTAVASDNYQVKRGDSLWKISVLTYGDGFQWTKIWSANKNKLKDPGKLEIGMSLVLPKLK